MGNQMIDLSLLYLTKKKFIKITLSHWCSIDRRRSGRPSSIESRHSGRGRRQEPTPCGGQLSRPLAPLLTSMPASWQHSIFRIRRGLLQVQIWLTSGTDMVTDKASFRLITWLTYSHGHLRYRQALLQVRKIGISQIWKCWTLRVCSI
jgi:hypothetical protein